MKVRGQVRSEGSGKSQGIREVRSEGIREVLRHQGSRE